MFERLIERLARASLWSRRDAGAHGVRTLFIAVVVLEQENRRGVRGQDLAGVALLWSGGGVAVVGAAMVLVSVAVRPAGRPPRATAWFGPGNTVGIAGTF